jgi:hypothetical protein
MGLTVIVQHTEVKLQLQCKLWWCSMVMGLSVWECSTLKLNCRCSANCGEGKLSAQWLATRNCRHQRWSLVWLYVTHRRLTALSYRSATCIVTCTRGMKLGHSEKMTLQKDNTQILWGMWAVDRLCGLAVRVPGYRSRGPCSIPGTIRFSE